MSFYEPLNTYFKLTFSTTNAGAKTLVIGNETSWSPNGASTFGFDGHPADAATFLADVGEYIADYITNATNGTWGTVTYTGVYSPGNEVQLDA